MQVAFARVKRLLSDWVLRLQPVGAEGGAVRRLGEPLLG
jgi:hypothetical protein